MLVAPLLTSSLVLGMGGSVCSELTDHTTTHTQTAQQGQPDGQREGQSVCR